MILSPLLLLSAATFSEAPYGVTKDGTPVSQVTLDNGRGMTVRVIGYGAIVTDVIVPDAKGRRADVALGFGDLADYETKNGDYAFGAVVGRFAGRIANARFTLAGQQVRLTPNDGPNALHGGPGGFAYRVWDVKPFRRGSDVGAVLSYASPAGEQGFPGRLDISVTYTVTSRSELRIDYEAWSNAPTVLNLTNHSYFNLAGAGSGTVRNHRFRVRSGRILETNEAGIPTGGYLAVDGTPFDFRRPKPIGPMLDSPHPQMEGRRGMNHSWAMKGRGLVHAATLTEDTSGRRLDVYTTEPSLHAYTANWFSGRDRGEEGQIYRQHDAIALETQHFPDAPNRADFPSTTLRPGEVYRSTTNYRFSTVKDR
jgi:aldose 1-epimerase